MKIKELFTFQLEAKLKIKYVIRNRYFSNAFLVWLQISPCYCYFSLKIMLPESAALVLVCSMGHFAGGGRERTFFCILWISDLDVAVWEVLDLEFT